MMCGRNALTPQFGRRIQKSICWCLFTNRSLIAPYLPLPVLPAVVARAGYNPACLATVLVNDVKPTVELCLLGARLHQIYPKQGYLQNNGTGRAAVGFWVGMWQNLAKGWQAEGGDITLLFGGPGAPFGASAALLSIC